MAKQIFDMHCHPSLKYLIREEQSFFNPHDPEGGPIGFCYPLSVYYDSPGAKQGGVKVLVNAHYVPENGFLKSDLLEVLKVVDIAKVIEDSDSKDHDGNLLPNSSSWDKLQQSVLHLQFIVDKNNQQPGAPKVAILKNLSDYDSLVASNDLVIIQGMEGAHHLGRNLGADSLYYDRLNQLCAQGFCVFTLSHFFLNDICDTAGGIPKSDVLLTNYQRPVADTPGLTPLGEEVVKLALNNNMLVDLVHSTSAARNRVYELNNALANPKPLAFTHTGVLGLYKTGINQDTNDYDYLASDDDITAIKNCNGVLGIILMNVWLHGVDDDSPLPGGDSDPVIKTIEYIKKICGSYDNIAIGTDLDGFTHVQDNVNQASKLQVLSNIITDKYGDDIANQILYGNAERVFRACCLNP